MRLFIAFRELAKDKYVLVEKQITSGFPLDDYMNATKVLPEDITLQQKLTSHTIGDMRMKIARLTKEAENKVRTCDTLTNEERSPLASTLSLDESESCYTEELVENKFRELNHQNQRIGKMKSLVRKVPNTKEPEENQLIYNTKNYEEAEALGSTASFGYVMAKKQRRQVLGIKKNLKNRYDQGISNLENMSTVPSDDCSKYGVTRKCKCGNTYKLSSKTHGEGKSIRDSVENNISCEIINGVPRSPQNKQTRKTLPGMRTYHEASMNTERPTHNASLVKVTRRDEIVETQTSLKPYQIQELPTVNIKPKLTKQVGPVIDIKVSKPVLKNNNVAIVECVHPDVLQENKTLSINRTGVIDTFRQFEHTTEQPAHPSVPSRVTKELKLQRCLKEMLNKLIALGPSVTHLKNSIQTLLELLKAIVPFHLASIRLQNENISLAEESIDLFFTNLDIVQEVIENELLNSKEKFCQNPEYIIRAVNLLCRDIRSIFDVSDCKQNSSKPSINNCHGKNKYQHQPKKNIQKPKRTLASSDRAESNFSSARNKANDFLQKDSTIPKDVYIPYQRLVPGGLHKELKEAKSMKDNNLRTKRLKKINKINKQLKEEFCTDIGESHNTVQNTQNENIEHTLNRTFIIENSDTNVFNEEKGNNSSESEPERITKSDVEYDDDWEQDLGSTSSSGNYGSIGTNQIVVAAQVHNIENVFETGHQSPTSVLSALRDQVVEKSISSAASDLALIKTSREEESISEQYIHTNERRTLVSTAIQTDELIANILPLHYQENKKTQNDCSSGMKINKSTQNSPLYFQQSSYPLLRMSNPITNALLEVRLPEHAENFQSSVHFHKTENKEEIEFLYNTNHSNETSKEILKNRAEETRISISDADVNGDKGSNKDSEKPNDFENITIDFIGFLESKVTEMVSKFKSSTTQENEKKLTEKLTAKQEKQSIQCSSQRTGGLCLKHNPPLYRSVSSLYSEKSTEELRFCKSLISRNTSPDNGRVKFENLISPPLTLHLMKESQSQTEFGLIEPKLIDACVGTSEEETIFIPHNDTSVSQTREKMTSEERPNSIKFDKTLHLSSMNFNNDINDLSQNRLLPLPEDVLMANANSDQTNIKKSSTVIVEHCENSNHSMLDLQIHLSDNTPNVRTDVGVERTSQIFASTIHPSNATDKQEVNDFLEGPNIHKLFPQPSSSFHMVERIPLTGCKEKSLENEHSMVVSGNADYGLVLSSCQNRGLTDSGRELTVTPENTGESLCQTEVNETDQLSQQLSQSENEKYQNILSIEEPGTGETYEVGETGGREQQDIYTDPKPETNLNKSQETIVDCEYENSSRDNDDPTSSKSSSVLLEEHITIRYYDSDDMSEGEVRFLYTSNSYSSGEVKLVSKNKYNNKNHEEIVEILQNNIIEETISADSHIQQSVNSSHKDIKTACENPNMDITEIPLVTMDESSPTIESINTGDLHHLLDSADESEKKKNSMQ